MIKRGIKIILIMIITTIPLVEIISNNINK